MPLLEDRPSPNATILERRHGVASLRSRTPQHPPRKRFGQNFLRDPGVIARIEGAIAPGADDHLVEIGPGLGALTETLLQSGCRLDAIELDRDLRAPLLAAFSIYPNFTLHSADALAFDYASLVTPAAGTPGDGDPPPGGPRLRIVGNLPYNISTPLIFHLLDFAPLVEDMHFMLQLEVVQRLTATPGSGHWGRLAIMAQFRCTAECLFEVSPEAFDPVPKVQSAIVRLVPHRSPPYPDCDAAVLARVVQAAFSQRRKTLRNTLRGLFDAAALEALGIDASARAETLELDDFVRLAEQLAGAPAEAIAEREDRGR